MSKYELNRTIKLNNDSEYSSLYSWSLEEYDPEGNKVEEAFIPMQIGSIYLDVEKLSYRNNFQRLGVKSESSDFIESEHIHGKLKTQEDSSQPFWRQTTNTFSMFGTDREIKDFSIEIYKTDNGDTGKKLSFRDNVVDSKKENCYLSGYVGWQQDEELDVTAHEAEDSLYIIVILKEERFNKIVQYIKDGVDARYISIGHADGFYNQWTPSIHLGSIKVLSNDRTGFGKNETYVQQVETAKGCDITPPRIDRLFDFNINFNIESNKFIDNDKENEDKDVYKEDVYKEDVYKDDYEIDNLIKLESSTDVISSQLSQISDFGLKLSKFSLNAIRLPLWIIAITLLLILIYK